MSEPPFDHEVEMFTLPSWEDTEYWERAIAAGLDGPIKPSTNGRTNGRFTWVNLTHPDYLEPPAPPIIHGMLYASRRHVISGPPESTKTLVAYMLLLEALRQGHGVAILDFEMGAHAAVTLLRELGATEDELAKILYTEPEGPPTPADIHHILTHASFALLDAAVGAYDTTGLSDNDRKDVEQFAGQWIKPLWQGGRGIATVTIDHVTKNADTRGKFTIGSERKTGQADVHLSLEALKPLHRGGSGLVRINVHKDRPGHLPRPTVHVISLESDTDHRITWELRAPLEPTSAGEFRHTIYMERISRFMEHTPDHLYSKNELETGVEGKRDHIRDALQELIEDGFVVPVEHGKWLKYHLVRPFAPGSPQFAPGERQPKFAPSPQPLQGAKAQGRTQEGEPAESSPWGEVNIYDPAIQALLDDK